MWPLRRFEDRFIVDAMESDLLGRRLAQVSADIRVDRGVDLDDETPAGVAAEPSLRWLPDQLTPGGSRSWLEGVRTDPGRAGVVALGAIAVLAILVTIFTVMRQAPPPVSAKLPPVQMVSSATASSTAAAPVSSVVSVVGLVTRPGLVTLAPEARVADAVSAAGGAQPGADVVTINMARKVLDGDQIVVGLAPAPGQPGMASSIASVGGVPVPSGSPSAAIPGRVNLNTATESELDALPGIGPVMAASIVRWRTEHGRFGSVDQLSEVEGIGPGRLDRLRDLVTL